MYPNGTRLNPPGNAVDTTWVCGTSSWAPSYELDLRVPQPSPKKGMQESPTGIGAQKRDDD